MDIHEIYERVSEKSGIPKDVVELAYRSFWMYIRETVSELPLKEDLSENEFDKLRVNFNIPSIGKLCCTYDRYRKVKDRYKYLKKITDGNDNKES